MNEAAIATNAQNCIEPGWHSPTAAPGSDAAETRCPSDSTTVTSQWHVLRTLSRQEKAINRTLTSAGYRVFLPLVHHVRIYGHRKRTVEAPLFPGYIFLWAPLEAAYFAVESGRVAQIIRVTDQDRLDHELAQIRTALQGEAQLDPYPYLRVGRRVRVTQGPFRGVEGLIDERRQADRLILVIDALGRATSMEIDASILAPID